MEEVGQALMRRAQEPGQGPLQQLRPGRRRSLRGACPDDAYEEHLLLPDERVALLTNCRLMLLAAPGFARCQAAAEEGVPLGSEEDVPVAQIRWAVEWRVR